MNGYLHTPDKKEGKLRIAIRSLLDRLEKQYPVEFENVLHSVMKDGVEVEEIRMLFGANWDVDHTSLFLKLNHSSEQIRAEAVKSVVTALLEGKVSTLLLLLKNTQDLDLILI